MITNNSNRRSFIKMTATAMVVAPSIIAAQSALSQEGEKLTEDNPTAITLGYKEKSSDVDATKYASHTDEQLCTGCVLYQGDDLEWGGCGAFPGKLVAGKGWCQAYAAKPS